MSPSWFSRSTWSLSAASTTVAALPGACPPEWCWKMLLPLATWAWLRRKTGQRTCSLVRFLASRSRSRTRKCGQWSRMPPHPQPRPRTGPRGQPNGWVSLFHREAATPLLFSPFLCLSFVAVDNQRLVDIIFGHTVFLYSRSLKV